MRDSSLRWTPDSAASSNLRRVKSQFLRNLPQRRVILATQESHRFLMPSSWELAAIIFLLSFRPQRGICFRFAGFRKSRFLSPLDDSGLRNDILGDNKLLGRFRRRRRQLACLDLGLETRGLVRAVAEGLILRVAAAAERDRRPACETERLVVMVHDGKIPFDAQRSVVSYSNFRCRHFSSIDLSIPVMR